MKSKFLKSALVATACTAVLSVSAFAASIGGGVITTGDAIAVNLREEPSAESAGISMIFKDTPVVVSEETDDDWFKVYYKGYEGYVSSQYLDFSKTMNADFGRGYISGTTVRMRQDPSVGSTVIAHFNDGTMINVIGISGDWCKVQSGTKTGYIRSDYVRLTLFADSSDDSASSDIKEPGDADSEASLDIISTAEEYIGVPYVYGGTSPSGFDCSGFTQYVYAHHGYSLNRVAAAQMSNGVAVSQGNLQAGDLVFFANGGGGTVGHVGIYISDGDFIHASSSSGVRISNLSESYYAGYYCGARRII